MRRTSRREQGFSLLEMLVVLTIIGVLSAVALPAYNSHVAKTRRGTAAGCLMEMGQFLERNYTMSLRYDRDSAGNALALPALQCRTDLGGFFTFGTTALAQTTYTLAATPAAKQKSADTSCGCTMSINQQGIKAVSACAKTVSDCWH